MSDAAITAIASGGAAVLGAFVGATASYRLQMATLREKRIEQRASAFAGFLSAARKLVEPDRDDTSEHVDRIEEAQRELDVHYLEIQLYAVNYVAEAARTFRQTYFLQEVPPRLSDEQRDRFDERWDGLADSMRVAIRWSGYGLVKSAWLGLRYRVGRPDPWERLGDLGRWER